MAFKDWFSRQTPLQRALKRGTEPSGDLTAELRNIGDYAIKTQSDAEAVCSVLESYCGKQSNVENDSVIHSLIGMFQQVDGPTCPAFAVLSEKGIEQLIEYVDTALRDIEERDANTILFAVKILAMYGTPEGTDAVLRAVRKPLLPDGFMWSVVLSVYTAEHPQSKRIFEELSNPLPDDFQAVALLDSANAVMQMHVDWPHPFDSQAGQKQLENWLTDTDKDHFSYAVSSAVALPFISNPEALFGIAFDHPSADVQLEAAWAAAKLGRESGIQWLARSCLDVNLAERAKQYLVELKRTDAIPKGSEDASFQAKAEFSQWLSHPNELGRAPDELDVLDHRELKWPPDYEAQHFWLIKYRAKDTSGFGTDDVGIGLVGSVTFCLFSYKLEQRPPEDCYAIHCYWEMNCNELITEAEVEEDSTEYNTMLRQCNIDGLNDVRIITVAEPSPKLRYPQKLVAFGKASRHGHPGWIVLDGVRSRWYSATEMPTDVIEKTVLMLHVGRVLLGFSEEPDRHRFLTTAAPSRTDEQFISAYQTKLNEVGQLEPSKRKRMLDSFSALGNSFDKYIDALIAINRQADVPPVIELFRPHWNHNMGYGRLGSAAYKSGHSTIAEPLFIQLRQSMEHWYRSEEMGHLAEIWTRQGRSEEAHMLLIDALKGLQKDSRTATGTDCQLHEDWFQKCRSSYLKLFPERGDAELNRNGIVSSTLAKPSA